MSNCDSENITRLVINQDQQQIELLFEEHRSRLRKMVAARMDPRLAARVDASDVVQETMLEAMRILPEYVLDQPLPFYPWLRQLATQRLARLAQQHIGAQRRSVTREQQDILGISQESVLRLVDQLVAPDSSPSQRAMQQEMQRRLRSALDELPYLDREVLVLQFIEEMSPAETAQLLDITPEAVGMRRLRALRRLGAVLQSE